MQSDSCGNVRLYCFPYFQRLERAYVNGGDLVEIASLERGALSPPLPSP